MRCKGIEKFVRTLRRFGQDKKGSVAVETALGVTMLFGVATILVDMHTSGLERVRLETGAGEMAQSVAAQVELTKYGLDALTTAAFQSQTRDTEIIIMNVLQSGRINWMLHRGDGAALCELDVDGDRFTADLPVDSPEESEDETDVSEMSMVVVEACRRTSLLKSEDKMVFPRLIQVRNIYRAGQLQINLDEALTDENMIASNDDDEEEGS